MLFFYMKKSWFEVLTQYNDYDFIFSVANPPDRAKDDSSVGAKNGQLSSKYCTSKKQLSNSDKKWQKATVKYWKSKCQILKQKNCQILTNATVKH